MAVGKTYNQPLNVSALTNNQLTGFTYDTAGNMTNNGSAFNYDAENRLVTAGGYTYYYDGDGNRVAKSNGSTGTLYWRGPTGDPISESSITGTSQEEYIFFNGTRIARRDVSGGAQHYYFSDHLGSHAVVENATGSSCEQDIDYYPYGGVVYDYCATVTQHYRFTGKERDSESGLDYFGARFNASSLGRFMTPDPGKFRRKHVLDPQGLNRYSYTRNNPLRFLDPDGKDWETAWNDLKAFGSSVYTKFTLGIGFGEDSKVGSGKLSAEASYTKDVKITTSDNGGVTFTSTAEVKATAEPGGSGAATGVAVGISQVDARYSNGRMTGSEAPEPIEVSPVQTAGSAETSVSKDGVGLEATQCSLVCVGFGAGSTKEGWSALGDAISNIKDEVILPTPPPPPTPPSPPTQ